MSAHAEARASGRGGALAAVSDRLLGPGAGRDEVALALGAGLAAALLVPLLAARQGADWTPALAAVAGLLAFDLVGGVVVNASGPARRYYHRPGRGAPHHLGFVALHALHVAAVAWLFRGGDARFAVAVTAGLVAAAALALAAPPHLRRGVATLAVAAAAVLAPAASPMPGMDWFVPVLFLKLLVCYLLGDLPPTPDRPQAGVSGTEARDLPGELPRS